MTVLIQKTAMARVELLREADVGDEAEPLLQHGQTAHGGEAADGGVHQH